MSDQDDKLEQVDEAQEDIELPNEQSEEVKGGMVWKDGGAGEDFAGNKKI